MATASGLSMYQRYKWIGLAVLSCGMLVAGGFLDPQDVVSSTQDIPPNSRAGETDTVDPGPVRPTVEPNRQVAELLPGRIPLWSVPLSVLTPTQERPIFSASRRPPRAVIVPPIQQTSALQSKPAEPDHPPLALIGVVLGDLVAIAVFVDLTNQKIVRLQRGESHAGWALKAIAKHEATLANGDQIEAIVLKGMDAPAGNYVATEPPNARR